MKESWKGGGNERPCMRCLLAILLAACVAASQADARPSSFVRVHGTRLEVDGVPYRFVGTNFWNGMNLGASDRPRLRRELDRLQALGVTNLRIMAGSEGPDTEPWRVVPAVQKAPGVHDADLLRGLDTLLAEMGRRHMRAVVCLNNFWPWSGGMAQYVQWAEGGSIPYPPPHPGGSWSTYQQYAARFYVNEKAVAASDAFVKRIVIRRNTATGRAYVDDATIMAWELANEPRGDAHPAALDEWIERSATAIKALDPNHLVTTGSEGQTPWPQPNGLDLERNHRHVDYATAHIWPQNWGWFDPAKPLQYDAAMQKVRDYFKDHVARARRLGKPLVFEEFGLARDAGSFDPRASTAVRDRFYADVFEMVHDAGEPVSGVNFWAWAGEARPREAGAVWHPGDPLIGDPPHELQGWYSVYEADRSTLKVIARAARRMR